MATRLKIQVGDNEITFEGEPDDVAARFDALAEKLLLAPQGASVNVAQEVPRRAVAEAAPKKSAPATVREASTDAKPQADDDAWKLPESSFDAGVLAKVFRQDGPLATARYREEQVPDALLLAMYGHHYVTGEDRMTAPALLSSVRESGLEIDRADRPLAERQDLWRSSGERRGKRYGLTVAGVGYCEELVRRRLETLHTSPVALERFEGLGDDE